MRETLLLPGFNLLRVSKELISLNEIKQVQIYIIYIYTALKTWLAIEARFTKTGEISMRAQSQLMGGQMSSDLQTMHTLKTQIEPDHFHNAQRNLPRAVQMYLSSILLPYMVHLKGKLP